MSITPLRFVGPMLLIFFSVTGTAGTEKKKKTEGYNEQRKNGESGLWPLFPFSHCISLKKKETEAVKTETIGGKATEIWDSRDA